MINIFATTLDQLSMNPGLLAIAGAVLALMIAASRQLILEDSAAVTVTMAAAISIAATTTFAVLTSLQTIATAPLA